MSASAPPSDIHAHVLAEVEARAAQATPVAVCVGVHWTFVGMAIDGKLHGGLASTLSAAAHDHTPVPGPPLHDAGQLLARDAYALASLVFSQRPLEAGVGWAALNALLEVDVARCVEVNAAEIIAKRGAGRRVAVVGHFPFLSRLRTVAETLWVLELDPRPGDLPAASAPDILPQADVVAMTGSCLLNHTFTGLIALCRPEAFVIMLGATTPLATSLFGTGLDALSGTLVVDPGAALAAVSQGATFRQIPGKRLLTRYKP